MTNFRGGVARSLEQIIADNYVLRALLAMVNNYYVLTYKKLRFHMLSILARF